MYRFIPIIGLIETGGREIVEASPRDDLWGSGAEGTGKNWLGKILVKLRERLCKQEQA
ncbi:hypothetical protein DB346_09275 [Verrucomicrobia bacterium LW23]|nr:hypothetical protein DB346_09275 [Verrucomicrobia bacterium LW23]